MFRKSFSFFNLEKKKIYIYIYILIAPMHYTGSTPTVSHMICIFLQSNQTHPQQVPHFPDLFAITMFS
jgi:hypothetical protein